VVVANNDDPPSLLKNTSGERNRWVSFTLIGTRSNRDAIGARVVVEARGSRKTREIVGAGSYLSQSDVRVHFGLGASNRIATVEVRWPSGLKQRFDHLPVDQFYVIEEGEKAIRGETLANRQKSSFPMLTTQRPPVKPCRRCPWRNG